MKALSLKLVAGIFLLISFSSFSKETIPSDYYISKVSLDKTLRKTESVFVLNFSTDNTKLAQQDIKFSYNNVQKTAITNANGNITIKVKPGKYLFRFFYNKEFFEITTDSISIKPAYHTEVKIDFKSSQAPIIAQKPVIYVYPEKSTQVSIKLDLKGKLGFTYPQYTNGWNFMADPDGTIHINNKKYHYLFWDGTTNLLADKINWNEGFLVNKNNLVSFFEEKLSQMGLKSNEIEDYITYWCPLMDANETNYIHFMFNEEYNEYAPLTVSPQPDTMFRVFMIWSKADQKEKLRLKEQTIQAFNRTGFSIVEWGGAQTRRFQNLIN
jgi:hypothetical protein